MLSSATRILCIATAAAVGAVGIAACGDGPAKTASNGDSSAGGKSLQKVVVQQGGTGFAWTPMLVAVEKGYFKAEGLDLQLNIGGGGSQVVAALLSGDIQFGNAGVQAALPAVAQGRKLQLVAPMSNGLQSNLVVTDKTWKKIDGASLTATDDKLQALKGAVLGVEGVGSASDSLTRYLFKSADMNPEKDVKIQAFKDQNAILAAFQAGTIDGFVYTSPTSDQAVSNYQGHFLVRVDKELPELKGIVYTGTMITEQYAKQNGKTVQLFVNALAKGGAFIEQCPDQSQTIIAASLKGLDGALLSTAYKNNRADYPVTPVSDPEGVQRSVTFTEQTSGKKVAVNLDEFLDNTFAEAAVKHLKDSNFTPECK